MKTNYIALVLATAAISSCSDKYTVPEPELLPQNIEYYSEDFTVFDLLYTADQKSKNTYIECWRSVDKSYVPFMQCIGPDGKLRWNCWTPLSDRRNTTYVNMNRFDVTTDGSIIDCYSGFGEDGIHLLPYVTKLSSDGEPQWGKGGKLFFDFEENAKEDDPCESFVAADNEGGAWVAAGNANDMLVIRRVKADGTMSDPIILTAKDGSCDDKELIRRPQMIVNDKNELFVAVQFVNMEGGGGMDIMLEGYYDLFKISSEGEILSQKLLFPEDIFKLGMRGIFIEDNDGGAYVIFRTGALKTHAYLYHFQADGDTHDFGVVDLIPEGSRKNVLDVFPALDPATGNLVCVLVDHLSTCSRMFMQTVDKNGNKLVGDENGKELIVTETGDFISTNKCKLINLTNGKMSLSYIYEPYMKYPILYKTELDAEGNMSEPEMEAELYMSDFSGGGIDSRDCIMDGMLRHVWFKSKTKYIFGYNMRVE